MWGLLDWLISQLCLKGPHGGVATRRSAPSAAILTATQIKIPEAWQLPRQARTTQLAKHSSFRGKLKHSTVKLPGCLLTFIKFFWSRTYFLWFSWAEFNSLPGSDSTLHSYATEWNTYGGLAESCMQATKSHRFNPLQDTRIWTADCPPSVGAKSSDYPVGRTGHCRYSMKAKARGKMLLQKVISIDKSPCGPAVDR